MSEKENKDKGRICIRLGEDLLDLARDAAREDGTDVSAIVRRCMVSSTSLRDRYRKKVDDLVKRMGTAWLLGK